MIGNAFQMGVPDLFVAHPKWGQRWIDVKRPGRNYSFTFQLHNALWFRDSLASLPQDIRRFSWRCLTFQDFTVGAI